MGNVQISEAMPCVVRFAGFQLDLRTAELHKAGFVISLQEQPFRILTLLLEHAGEVVTRDDLRKRLWPEGIFVNFDDSINSAIKKLRHSLDDSAEEPWILETLPRRGYRLLVPVEPAGSPSESWQADTAERLPRLAVLPFQNLSGDTAHEYLADGLTFALITALAKDPTLCVISRMSVMPRRFARDTISEMTRELRLDAVLEGAVVRSGNRVRVTIQLVRRNDGQHLWAEIYEHELRDILEWQRDVTQAIVKETSIRMTDKNFRHGRRPAKRGGGDTFVKGRYFLDDVGRSDEGLRKACNYFHQAILDDSSFAKGYAGIAESYNMMAIFGLLPPSEVALKSRAAAECAIEIDTSLSEGHAALAYALMLSWDWPGAEKEFNRAIKLNPNYATARRWYAEYLMAIGETAKAIAQIECAWAIEPFSLPINNALGWFYYGAGRFDEAAQQCRRTVELDPDFAIAHSCFGMAQAQQGRYSEAIREYQTAKALGGTITALRGLGYVYALAGDKDQATQILNESQQLTWNEYLPSYNAATIYAGMGENDRAFEWLDRACEKRDAQLAWLKWDPQLDTLRLDSRFRVLVERVGLSL
jgi:TolB-like protein/Tfp pilus assembly protein PilF